jgi:hypothetical protein
VLAPAATGEATWIVSPSTCISASATGTRIAVPVAVIVVITPAMRRNLKSALPASKPPYRLIPDGRVMVPLNVSPARQTAGTLAACAVVMAAATVSSGSSRVPAPDALPLAET